MFIKVGTCPVCFSPWEKDSANCISCGSIVELYYERPLADKEKVDEQKLEKNVNRIRNYLVDHDNHGPAHYTLGLLYVNLGLLPEGLGQIKRAAELMPEKVQIAYEAVVLAAKQGDYSDDVLDQINRIIKRKPEFIEALYLLGVILGKRNQFVEAARVMQRAYKLDAKYEPSKKWLTVFISKNEDLFKNPAIVRSISKMPLPQNALNYLERIGSGGPVEPPPLGKTSMKILEAISPETAKRMWKMHSERLHRHEEINQHHSKELGILAEDLVTLSELSIAAYEARGILAASSMTRSPQTTANSGSQLSVAERSKILDVEVSQYQKQGFTLLSRTDTTAQLSKKNEFDFCLALFLVIIVIGIFIYLLYFLTAKKGNLVFIEVDEFGRIHKTHS